jgi:hypothetical protein
MAGYDDVFDHPRVTLACSKMYLPQIDWDSVERDRHIKSTASRCPDWNCYDQECAKYRAELDPFVPDAAYAPK